MLTDGDTAPDFVLPGTDGGDEVGPYALVDLLDRGPVVVAFYLFDFHPSCTDQVCAIRDLSWFELMGATAVAVSTDSAFSHRAFARDHGINFPLLSDDTGQVADAYGVLSDGVAHHGLVARRSVFVIDTDWTVRYAWVADDPGELPDWEPVKTALEELD